MIYLQDGSRNIVHIGKTLYKHTGFPKMFTQLLLDCKCRLALYIHKEITYGTEILILFDFHVLSTIIVLFKLNFFFMRTRYCINVKKMTEWHKFVNPNT